MAFHTTATNLPTGQTDFTGSNDVFLYERANRRNGPKPVADYDGNGTTDIAVFRPSTGHWFVRGGAITHFGTSGDIPAPGDYDGNGATDIAVFRPSTGTWFVNGGATMAFGTSGDVPLPLAPAIHDSFF